MLPDKTPPRHLRYGNSALPSGNPWFTVKYILTSDPVGCWSFRRGARAPCRTASWKPQEQCMPHTDISPPRFVTTTNKPNSSHPTRSPLLKYQPPPQESPQLQTLECTLQFYLPRFFYTNISPLELFMLSLSRLPSLLSVPINFTFEINKMGLDVFVGSLEP